MSDLKEVKRKNISKKMNSMYLCFFHLKELKGSDWMKITIGNIELSYIQYGEGEDVVLLHGWGQNIEMMRPLGDPLSQNYRVTILDLPGFGESSEPDISWTLEDYVSFLSSFFHQVKVQNPILIGHSFGGPLAIIYASKYKVKKVVLFGAPCVRLKKDLSLKEKTLKRMKQLPLMQNFAEKMKKYIGSTDYKNATEVMRKILVNTVNLDLSEFAKKIEVPTLLIWGEDDQAAPVKEAKMLEALLKDGALIVLPGTHYAYLENLQRVLAILKKFLEG